MNNILLQYFICVFSILLIIITGYLNQVRIYKIVILVNSKNAVKLSTKILNICFLRSQKRKIRYSKLHGYK